jgi:NAD(P)H-dependent FMN reductase
MSLPRLSVVIASTRPTRIGPFVTEWVLDHLPDGFELTVHDLREIDLPFLDEPHQPFEGRYTKAHTKRWSAAMQATDALVLVMPEYNRGYNAALKNAIDYLYAEWEGLPVGCVGYGWHGASYAKSALRQTLERVRMTWVEGPGLAFDESLTLAGELLPGEQLDTAAEGLATMFEELRARARTPSRRQSSEDPTGHDASDPPNTQVGHGSARR